MTTCPDTMTPDIASVAAALGFRPMHQGGGCWALELSLADGRYCLITDNEGASLPESLDAMAWLGEYDADVDAGAAQEAPAGALLLSIYGPIAGEPLPDALQALERFRDTPVQWL